MKTDWKTPDLQAIKQRVVDKLTLAGEIVVSDAKAKCATDGGPFDTGNLAGSIICEVDASTLAARIGTPVEYAPFVEFGTGEFAEGGNGRKGGWIYDYQGNKGPKGLRFTLGSKPKPFLRPALLENREKIRGIMNVT